MRRVNLNCLLCVSLRAFINFESYFSTPQKLKFVSEIKAVRNIADLLLINFCIQFFPKDSIV